LFSPVCRATRVTFRKVIEAIIAEECVKQHKVLADKLEDALNSIPFERQAPTNGGTMLDPRPSNLIHEIMPQRQLADLILPPDALQITPGLIEEQQRVDILRSYNLEPRNRVLLIGAPGNGKTSLAEAIAEALAIPLLVVRYESIVGTYLGETANRLKKIFEGDTAEPITDGDSISIQVNCGEDAKKNVSPISYGLLVSLEVAEGLDISIYNEIRTRIAPAIKIQQLRE
jgi:hypothetical protein